MAGSTTTKADADLYEEDFHLWTQRQAELLRGHRFADLDLANLIEEVEDLGKRDRRRVESRTQTIIEHLLKLTHSPAAHPRPGWQATVARERDRLQRDLSASLRNHLLAALPSLYTGARRPVVIDLKPEGVAADSLPLECPYTLDEILDPDWFPTNVHGLVDD
jgi:hypothetical protein